MTFSRVLSVATAATVVFSPGAALSMSPGGGLNNNALSAYSLVEKVHGCHRVCALGPAGWHYHAGPACIRVACVASPGGPWIWRCGDNVCGWWHPGRRAWWR